MEALRIVLKQTSANYRRPETVNNRMTYPLPPISTIIGALHVACGFKEYKPMDISIQGKYESMHKEPYTDYCFLNSTMDDRGTLVKMRNADMLSTAYEKVASAKKSQGNSFRKETTIQIYNAELLKEYQELKNLNDKISNFKNTRIKKIFERIKSRKSKLAKKKSNYDRRSIDYKRVEERDREIKNIEKGINERLKNFERENYSIPISRFKGLTTSIKHYEILDNITLVLHIKSDSKTLNMILENIYNLTSIGRSEDFVHVESAEFTQLISNCDGEIISRYSAYLDYDQVMEGKIFTRAEGEKGVFGTKYYLNKNYEIKNGKREFVKVKVLYASEYTIEETSENILIDNFDGDNYIVNFL